MTTTTRRVTVEELQRIKSIQEELAQKGVKLSQTEISSLMSEYVMDHYEDFVKEVVRERNEDKDYQSLDNFLNETFEGKETDSVKEHDVII